MPRTDFRDIQEFVAFEIRDAIRCVRRDRDAGFCTPERLEAQLQRIAVAVCDLEDDDRPVFEVTPQGIVELHNLMRPGRPVARLAVIKGGKP